MKRRLGLVCAAAMASIDASAALAPDDLFRQVSPSVWTVVTTDDAGKPLASGSAVVTAPQTLVTNCHVLKGAAGVSVRQRTTVHRATLQHADAERDLCQLQAPTLQAPPIAVAPGPARVGQRIYTVGAPLRLEATLSDGLVSGLRDEAAGGGYIQISAPISPGSSGGGLFDDEGRLLGITTSGMVGVAQNLNFARPALLIPEIPVRAAAALQKWREARAAPAPAPAPLPPVASISPDTAAGSAPQAPRTRVPSTLAPPPVRIAPPPPTQPARIASGFAAIDDIDAVPFLGDRGREGYRAWLGKGTPRAFALAPTGHWASSWGVKTTDPQAPVDPSERALAACERSARAPCRLYAVNNSVVWTRETATAARSAAAPPPTGEPTRP